VDTFDYRDYTTDTFFSMRWRWRWGVDLEPHRVAPFCSKCGMPIHPARPSGRFAVSSALVFQCMVCNDVPYATSEDDIELADVTCVVTLLVQANVRRWRIKFAKELLAANAER
jgi:hypothetical protein